MVCEEIRVRPENSEVQRLYADNTLAGNVLGWQPKVPLTEGLNLTIQWISANLSLFEAKAYTI